MSNPTLLFVDDEPNVTSALKRAFRREPYEILSADSAKVALELLRQREVDVVISDERMPEMTGSEFLAAVRRWYPRTIRMILTGEASLDAAIRAINEGEVYRFFTKPCSEVDLKIAVRYALQQRELATQSRLLLQRYRRQEAMLEKLERQNPGITRVDTDSTGAYVISSGDANIKDLLQELTEANRPVTSERT